MKRAININLGGMIFHIDEDAYDKLKSYIAAISAQFDNNTEAREIVADIESRMAELFTARLSSNKQVIGIADVEAIIAIMGEPNEFGDNESKNEPPFETNNMQKRAHRRFYRDVDNAVLGGVCSGLGAYFNIDPVIVRIIFVLLFFVGGATFLIYIILWLALPPARTAAQKLEMRGEPINISNIEKTIKDEYEQVKQNMERMNAGGKMRNFFESFMFGIFNIFKGIFKAIAIFIGFIFIIVGVSLIIAFAAVAFGHPVNIHSSNIQFGDVPFFLQNFAGTSFYSVAAALLFALVAIPILAAIYGGLKIIFRFKTNDRKIWISSALVWLASLIAFVILFVATIRDFGTNFTQSTGFDIQTSHYPSLTITANSTTINQTELETLFENHNGQSYYRDENNIIYGMPEISIYKSKSETATVRIEKKARGRSSASSNRSTQSVQIEIFQRDSVLLIDPLFTLSPNTKWRAQQANVNIYLPVGCKVYFDQSMLNLLKNADIAGNYWLHELIGKTWVMGNNGLELHN